MTINRAINRQKGAVDAFIGIAPHGCRSGTHGKERQIILTIAPGLLANFANMASRIEQSRAALINPAICQLTERVAT
jgi:hypothetical protein